MKSIVYTLLLGSALAAGITSCTDEENPSSADGRVYANISAGITSRAVDNTWNENDAIGITMLSETRAEVIAPYTNYSYTTKGDGEFSPNPSDKRIYFPQDGSKVTFKAYYPYSVNYNDMTNLPVSVAEQTDLPTIDLMTAEHISGDSKEDAHVKLHFYHRLAKILVNLSTDGEDIISLDGCKLVIKGLKTTGSYNLMTESLSVNENSGADMAIPLKNNSGKGIILPRMAGAGITFEVTTANGETYTATMNPELEIKGGYKHTFNIMLKKTPTEVSATIEEWKDGPEVTMEVVKVVTGLEDNVNITEGSLLHLYLKDQGDFAHIADYTYTSADTWTTETPVYWESISADPASFRGTLTLAGKLNDTQMDDWMVSADVEADQYTATNLKLSHVGAKATVVLKSTNGTFSAEDLKGATITFPGYKNTGTINEKGEFVIGTTTTDILAADGVAIFPPQTISAGNVVAVITINGRAYEIKAKEGGFDFAQGKNTKLILDLSKADIQVSTEILAWGDGGTHNFTDVKIGTATLNQNEGDLVNDDKLYLFTGDATDRIQLPGGFTYSTTGKSWKYSETTPLYWEDIAREGYIYASITRPAVSATGNNNQLPDYITATPIENYGGTDNTALNFKLNHAVSKVVVILNSKTYNLEILKGATVILPSYTIGGKLENGIFNGGTSKGDITIDGFSAGSTDNGLASTESSAYLQAQAIAGNSTVVKVTIDGRIYEAKQEEVVTYTAGKVTTLTVNIEKSAVNLSANVTPWTQGDIATFEGLFFTTSGNASGFNDNDKIRIFKIADGKVNGASNDSYTYAGNETTGKFSSTTPWYRDDFQTSAKISAVYPTGKTTVSNGNKTFSWSCPTGTDANAHANDVMVATGTIGTQADISLPFKHVLSKVTVNIIAGEGFINNELKDCVVALNNFYLAGTIDIVAGTATPTGTASGSFTPNKLGTAETNAAASHQALIIPQTINMGTTVVTVTLNHVGYEAKLDKAMEFKAGEAGVLNITLKKTGISLQASVAPWEKGPDGDITIQ